MCYRVKGQTGHRVLGAPQYMQPTVHHLWQDNFWKLTTAEESMWQGLYLLDQLPEMAAVLLHEVGDIAFGGAITGEGNAETCLPFQGTILLVLLPLVHVVEICCMPATPKVQVAWRHLLSCSISAHFRSGHVIPWP